MTEWRDISTAPRDGREILVFERGHVIHVRWGGTFHNAFMYCYGLGFSDYATHWTDLPEPPT